MPRRKPEGWPSYMVAKRLKSVTGYYWDIPTWAKKRDCSMKGEALGTDYAAAKRRCDELLNPQFAAWRTEARVPPGSSRAPIGTFDWMVSVYKTLPKYTTKVAKTKKSYDAALNHLSDYRLKDGRRFGELALVNITGGVADRLFEKLRFKEDGTERGRTGQLMMIVARTAWKYARRDKPDIVPALNPFDGMDLDYEVKETRPVTLDQLNRFVPAADAEGDFSIGDAAMIAFYWLQREVDILGRLSWTQYRPADAPDIVKIFHHKTGELVDVPLYDDDGTALWPELMARLDARTRHGTLIVTRDKPDRNRKAHLPWREDYFRHRVAAIRAKAGIDPEVKFMGLRHGGQTEMADAGLTDAQIRALSGHRTAEMTRLYAKGTRKQRQAGARKMLEARTKQGNLSE